MWLRRGWQRYEKGDVLIDLRTGRIVWLKEEAEFLKNALEGNKSPYLKLTRPPTKEELRRRPERIRRNAKCPCGSGKKFKRCCLII
jgi:uncharacterized protein YecA (UPF0149 family)